MTRIYIKKPAAIKMMKSKSGCPLLCINIQYIYTYTWTTSGQTVDKRWTNGQPVDNHGQAVHAMSMGLARFKLINII